VSRTRKLAALLAPGFCGSSLKAEVVARKGQWFPAGQKSADENETVVGTVKANKYRPFSGSIPTEPVGDS